MPKQCDILTANPIHTATGNKFQTEQDYIGEGSYPLRITRYYNSQGRLWTPTESRHIGSKWSHHYQRRIVFYTKYSNDLATAYRQDGKEIPFSKQGGDWVAYGVAGRLSEDTAQTFPGSAWRYRDNQGTEFYDAAGRLLVIVGNDGFTHTIVRDAQNRISAVHDEFGNQLSFEYDATDRIASITTPSGVVRYAYDPGTVANLTSVAYPDDTPADDTDNPTRVYHYEDTRFPTHLTGITDERGNRYATWSYNNQGRAISSEHAGGTERYTLVYNTDDTTTVTDPLGHTRTSSFVTEHGLIKVDSIQGGECSQCGGDAQSYTYDANGFLASKTDFNGNLTTYINDARGLQTSRTEAVGTPQARTITTEWHPDFRLPVRITESGRVTEYTYNDRGQVLTRTLTDPANGRTRTTAYTYKPPGPLEGLLETVDGPRTDVEDITTYGYDAQGNRTSVTNALGHVTQITQHDAAGRPLTLLDPNGVQTQLSYDPRGRLDTSTKAGAVTDLDYDDAGNVTRVTRPDGTYLDYTYDAANRLTDVVDGLGNRITYTLDVLGNRTREEIFSPGGTSAYHRTRLYNDLNRLEKVIGAMGQETVFGYDAQGNRISVTDGNQQITTYGFDALNRLSSALDPLNGTTENGYDPLGNLTSVEDPNGNLTSYVYDGLGNRIERQSPDTGLTTYTYDDAGNRLSETDARGITVLYSYDALNRPSAVAYPDPSLDRTFGYDQGAYGIGRLTSMGDASGTTSYAYDQRGDLVTEARTVDAQGYPFGYTYDVAGRLASITYPSGKRVDYGRDATGRVNEVSLTAAGVTTALVTDIHYLPFGPMTALTFGNGQALTRSYDADYRTSAQTSTGLQALTYTVDPVGNIREIADGLAPNRDQAFEYDALDRLIHAAGAYGSRGYDYDAVGNRTQLDDNGLIDLYTSDPAGNRLLTISGQQPRSYTYDGAGNITGDGLREFRYDDLGRLSAVYQGTTLLASYAHNGHGERVKKTVGADTTHYLYGTQGRLLAEADAQGGIGVEYVYLDGVPIALLHAADHVTYVHTDHLGTPRLLTDAGQRVVWRWRSTPFGRGAAEEDPDGDGASVVFNMRFPGQYFDSETGLHYNYFRDYDPQTGRYIESDPIGLDGGLNTYGYAGGNPMLNVDPEGLAYSPWGEHGIGADGKIDPDRKKANECFQKCLEEQWDMFRTASAAGAAPIPKPLMGVPTTRGASPVTNPISAAAHHVTKNTKGKGRIGRQILGTNRWGGLLGRLNLLLLEGMIIYDVTKCEIECKLCR